MKMLIFKLILFVVLTSIPFIGHYFIQARKKKEEKQRNNGTNAQPYILIFSGIIGRIEAYLINFHDKMKHRKNPRKFFTLLLFLFLIGVQAIDNLASGEVAATYKAMAKEKRLDELSINGKKTETSFMQRRMNNYLYPFLTQPIVYYLSFGLTLMLLSYKMANYVLTEIHNNKRKIVGISIFIIFFTLFDEGRFLLFSELLFILTMAALAYPNFCFSPPPKGRKTIPQEDKLNRLAA